MRSELFLAVFVPDVGRVTMSVLKQLENFLSEQRAALLRPDRSLEQLAASINNNLHCYEHSMELAEALAVHSCSRALLSGLHSSDEQRKGRVVWEGLGGKGE